MNLENLFPLNYEHKIAILFQVYCYQRWSNFTKYFMKLKEVYYIMENTKTEVRHFLKVQRISSPPDETFLKGFYILSEYVQWPFHLDLQMIVYS